MTDQCKQRLVKPTNHSTMFALLVEFNVIYAQRWIQFELQIVSAKLLPFMAK